MPLSRALTRQVPMAVRARGDAYFNDGAVVHAEADATRVEAIVRGTRPYRVWLARSGRDLTASCECQYFVDREDVCKHIWAVLLEAERSGFLGLEHDDGESLRLRAAPSAAAGPPATRTWQRFISNVSLEIARAERDAPPPRFRGAEIVYAIDRDASLVGASIALDLLSRTRTAQGRWGRPKRIGVSMRDVPQLPDPIDREILPLLLGARDAYPGDYLGAEGRGSFRLGEPLLDRVLPMIVQSGRAVLRVRRQPGEELIPLTWDDGPAWVFRLDVGRRSHQADISIDGALVRGAERLLIREPTMILPSGYFVHAGRVSRLDARRAFTLLAQLRGTGPLGIPPGATGQLVDVLARSGVDPSDLPEELRFDIVAAPPRPIVQIKADAGGPGSSLLASLAFEYAGTLVEPAGSTTLFDREERRLVRRDVAAETAALKRLADLGFHQRWDFARARPALRISAAQLPRVVRELAAEGWRVEAEGRAFRPAQSMRSEVRSGIDWFELHGIVDFGDGLTAPLPRLLEAVRHGRTSIVLDDGSEGMVPEEWLRRFAGIARAGETSDDHLRFRTSQAALLDAALANVAEVRFDEKFQLAQRELATLGGGLAPIDAAGSFAGTLRDYQRDALGWFAFLRRFGFGGCLADDMGLGKTVMVLAWLDRLRSRREGRGPSLVVVPRSVVFNWMEEAARFAPELKVLDFSGADRSVGRVQGHHLVVTTYGALRRDALLLRDVEFEYAILDEAQAIKNANTAGAKAARLLRARHRLALSGTPVENHLGELWSLFDFLNPGMLGTSSSFARHGVAAARRDREALDVLARGVRPFILRRTKTQVAPELPPRTELTIRCELQGAQRELYAELREHYRATLLRRIHQDGLQKSKMQILEALLRLRQAACHPGLVDPRRAADPSAKFDALMPQLREIRDEGHKVLVFSQFTSLLALLRHRLDAEHAVYEYLDGKTRDREARVRRFQDDPSCGIFLISLKAGGLGLNLTAAEYVFLLDPWWNPAVESQAIDRAHRIGQRRHVFAYRLLAADTVEDKTVALQQHKRDLADAIVRADTGLLRNLKPEDLEILLS
jgi:superfamily II DNA or RNA helicase